MKGIRFIESRMTKGPFSLIIKHQDVGVWKDVCLGGSRNREKSCYFFVLVVVVWFFFFGFCFLVSGTGSSLTRCNSGKS